MKMVPDHGNFRLKMLLRFDSSEHYTPRSLRRYERAKRISGNEYVFGQNSGQNMESHGGEIFPSFATFLLTDCRLFNVPKKKHVVVIDAGCGHGILLSHIAMAQKMQPLLVWKLMMSAVSLQRTSSGQREFHQKSGIF